MPGRTPRYPSILHYVHHALPWETGYSLRTQAIGVCLQRIGYVASICARPGFKVASAAKPGPYLCRNGVHYYGLPAEKLARDYVRRCLHALARCGCPGAYSVRRARDMTRYIDWLERVVGPVELIHAHSPPEVGRQAMHVASSWKAPLVYEVRGFWSLSDAADEDTTIPMDEATASDSCVARDGRVRHVVAICQGIADELVRQKVDARKISIVPNGVDTSAFRPQKRDEELLHSLGLKDRFVFGYITSVRRLEGLQCAIQAWPAVVKAIPEAVFILVGTGPYLDALKQMANERGLGDSFRFIGPVPHAKVLAYYSLLEVFVVPRISAPVCQLVTPLKPLEAMAMDIPVIASGVSALREMVRDGRTGLIFEPDNPDSFASVCIQMGRDDTLRKRLATAARAWVEQERDWAVIASRYSALYSSLLGL